METLRNKRCRIWTSRYESSELDHGSHMWRPSSSEVLWKRQTSVSNRRGKRKFVAFSLWPSFTSLNSKQRQHGSRDVVVVEVLIIPNSFLLPRQHFFVIEHKVRSSAKGKKSLLKSVTKTSLAGIFLLAFFFRVFALVRAEEKLSVEQLNGNDGEYKLKQYVHDQDVDDVL